VGGSGNGGKAKYVPGENVVIWKIPRLQGTAEASLSGLAVLTSTTTRTAWARPPIDVEFEVGTSVVCLSVRCLPFLCFCVFFFPFFPFFFFRERETFYFELSHPVLL
jgi:hypothetical protein